MTEEHVIGLVADDDLFRPYCSCGWTGGRASEIVAGEQGERHVRALTDQQELWEQVRQIAYPSEVVVSDEPPVNQSVSEIESGMAYLGMDDAIVDLAAKVKALQEGTVLPEVAECIIGEEADRRIYV